MCCRARPELTITDVLAGQPLTTLRYEQYVTIRHFAFSHDQRILAVAGGTAVSVPVNLPGGGTGYRPGEVCVWDLEMGKIRFRHREEEAVFFSLAVSPAGDLVAAGGGECYGDRQSGHIVLLDATTGKLRQTLNGQNSPVLNVAFAPDGKTIVSSASDRFLRFWDVATADEVAKVPVGERANPWAINHFAFSPDATLLAVALSNWNRGQKNGEIYVLDARDRSTLAVLLRKNHQPITSVAFSPDGRLLAACGNDAVHVWNIIDESRATQP